MIFRSRMAAAALALPLLAGCASSGGAPVPAAPPPARFADTVPASRLSEAFRAASEQTLPAVVFIASEQLPQMVARQDLREQIPEPFRDLFPAPDPTPRPRTGAGSGVIFDERGYILTNNHVVADATRLTVRMVDGREYAARLIGGDVASDIAVIKIEPAQGERLPVATLGSSEQLRVGDWVLALGSPLGLDFTVTAGIVSAMGRRMPGSQTSIESFIQTDAVINPGNSGGPLIDLAGRVVGINSAIFGSDRFVGYGFAVPVSIARRVSQDLLEFGYLRRPRIGLGVRAVTAVDAELYRLSEIRGAFVIGVEHDGTARAAGMRAGDIVLALNGTPIRDDADFIARLAGQQPDQQVTLGIVRDGRTQDVRVRLGEWERPAAAAQAAPPSAATAGSVLGFTVRDLTPEHARRAEYRGEGGVVVDSVAENGPAVRRIGVNQVVLALNGQRVRTAEQFRAVAAAVRPGSPVAVTVYDPRYGETIQVFRARQE